MTETTNATRNNKNSIFTSYFNDTKKLIELYNAIENTDYPEDTHVEINTLSNAIFRKQNNDISFTLDDKLIILIEHQLCEALHNWCYAKQVIM